MKPVPTPQTALTKAQRHMPSGLLANTASVYEQNNHNWYSNLGLIPYRFFLMIQQMTTFCDKAVQTAE